ncbi:frizzled class receptor [Rhynchophorus ferrugineus]|uniref:frizzled class receptor n=1 Tax=Rhynchophorus ferrugineus TaxID=354439 RepID=UPI003FCD8656
MKSYFMLSLILFVGNTFGVQYTSGKVTYKNDVIPHHNKCQPITVPFCKGIPYNQTILPNLLGHNTQEEAGLEVHQYFPLININCSAEINFFLCAVFVPVCTIIDQALPPCRSLCLRSRDGCEGLMTRFGFRWPEFLNCERFPDNTDREDVLCVGRNTSSAPSSTKSSSASRPHQRTNNFYMPPHGKSLGFVCPEQFKVPADLGYSFKVGERIEKNCGAPCHMMFFNEQKIHFSRVWVGIWSILCSVSCLFTVSTFLIDTDRFRYPERPIIFLSICYFMVACAYLVGFLSQDSISCRQPFPSKHGNITVSTITQGTRHEGCAILFMIVYFFSMASNIWWIVLTLTWFLAAGLKWGHEAIEANSQYFHLAAWTIPAVKTITILALGKVDGDILSGVCYVGIWNVEAMRTFILIPLIIYLIIGTAFLTSGFVSLFRIRTVMKHEGNRTEKLEKLMIRIGIFSVLYTLPALIVIGCLFYESTYFDDWMDTWWADICRNTKYSVPCPGKKHKKKYPHFEAFMIKYLMTMIVGITSSVWIWSGFGKTVHSWKVFFNSLKRKRVEAYV